MSENKNIIILEAEGFSGIFERFMINANSSGISDNVCFRKQCGPTGADLSNETESPGDLFVNSHEWPHFCVF